MENIHVLLACSVLLILLALVVSPKEVKIGKQKPKRTHEQRVKETFKFVKNLEELKVEKDNDLLRLKNLKSTDFSNVNNNLEIETKKVPEIILEKMVYDKVYQEKQAELNNLFETLAKNHEKNLLSNSSNTLEHQKTDNTK